MHKRTRKLLAKIGLYEILDLELRISIDHVASLNITPRSELSFYLSPANRLAYIWRHGEVNERGKLPIQFDIYPKHYIFFLLTLFNTTFISSIFGLGIAIVGFSTQEYTMAFGSLSIYSLFLFLFPIRLLKRMQWRIWDLRLEIEKDLKMIEQQLNN
ncbi:MAG: hypothetical protein WAZ98_04880 [Cyclobacteriaceae bacterium]